MKTLRKYVTVFFLSICLLGISTAVTNSETIAFDYQEKERESFARVIITDLTENYKNIEIYEVSVEVFNGGKVFYGFDSNDDTLSPLGKEGKIILMYELGSAPNDSSSLAAARFGIIERIFIDGEVALTDFREDPSVFNGDRSISCYIETHLPDGEYSLLPGDRLTLDSMPETNLYLIVE